MNFLQKYSGAISAAATLLIAIFTGTLWRSTGRLWKMTKTSVDAVRQAERAYVKMSHTAPAFDLVKTIGQGGLTVEIKNSGRTPATVTDVLLQVNWFGEENPAPNEPEYRIDARRISVGFFLVAQESSFHEIRLHIPNEGDGDELWLYGYVDYVDEFNQHHRAGYVRVHLEDRPENNLVFVNRPGWNYDRRRKRARYLIGSKLARLGWSHVSIRLPAPPIAAPRGPHDDLVACT